MKRAFLGVDMMILMRRSKRVTTFVVMDMTHRLGLWAHSTQSS
jgi:hypothetical protein